VSMTASAVILPPSWWLRRPKTLQKILFPTSRFSARFRRDHVEGESANEKQDEVEGGHTLIHLQWHG
jgi:hypothetical protein